MISSPLTMSELYIQERTRSSIAQRNTTGMPSLLLYATVKSVQKPVGQVIISVVSFTMMDTSSSATVILMDYLPHVDVWGCRAGGYGRKTRNWSTVIKSINVCASHQTEHSYSAWTIKLHTSPSCSAVPCFSTLISKLRWRQRVLHVARETLAIQSMWLFKRNLRTIISRGSTYFSQGDHGSSPPS